MPKGEVFRDGREQVGDVGDVATRRGAADWFYLASDGKANTLNGDGAMTRTPREDVDKPDKFIYDPREPVSSFGGNVCCTGNAAGWRVRSTQDGRTAGYSDHDKRPLQGRHRGQRTDLT